MQNFTAVDTPPGARPLRTLVWCTLAIFIAFVAFTLARGAFTTESGGLFSYPALAPSAQYDDSWRPMLVAFQYLSQPHDVPVYSKVFMEYRIKFQYPLTSLFVLYFVDSPVVLTTIGAVLILLGSVVMVLLFNRFWTDAGNGPPLAKARSGEQAIRVVIPLVMTLTFYPIISGYTLGQIQTWLATGFFIVVWLWMIGAVRTAGVLLGILTLVKPQFGLILIWGLLRRKWSFSIAFGVTLAVGGIASLALFGWRDNLDYLNALSFLSRNGETFFLNQSVNGFMNRLLMNGESWNAKNTFDRPFNQTIYLVTLTTTIALMLMGLFVPARHRGGVADLLLAGFTCTIASPVAWNHHYSVVLPAFAAMFAWSMRHRPLGRLTLPLLCVSYVLLGTYIAGFWRLSGTRLNVVQSYPFAGALIALFLMYVWVIRGEPGAKAEAVKERTELPSGFANPASAQALVS
jgi:alpha-1,2-mannosyltransferase